MIVPDCAKGTVKREGGNVEHAVWRIKVCLGKYIGTGVTDNALGRPVEFEPKIVNWKSLGKITN